MQDTSCNLIVLWRDYIDFNAIRSWNDLGSWDLESLFLFHLQFQCISETKWFYHISCDEKILFDERIVYLQGGKSVE